MNQLKLTETQMTTRSKTSSKRPLDSPPPSTKNPKQAVMGKEIKEKRAVFGEVTNQKNNNTSKENVGKGTLIKGTKVSRLPTAKNVIQTTEASKKSVTTRGSKPTSSTLPRKEKGESKASVTSHQENKEASAKNKEEAKNVQKNIDEIMNARNAKLTNEIKARIPEGVTDFDSEGLDDPFQVSEYVYDIFEYYKRREAKFAVKKYLDQDMQNELNFNMRAILVDWMVEVQESFELNHETLYLAVKLVDLYLSKVQNVRRDKLQLIGATAMFVSAKYDERNPPVIDDFCYICDDAYSQKDVLQMEVRLLKTLDYDIGAPLSYRFLRRYARCAKLEMQTLTLARYILEMSLADYNFIDVSDSQMASASLLLALNVSPDHKAQDAWTSTLQYYSGYSKSDISDLCHRLFTMVRSPPQNVRTIRAKYSHKVFYEVAKIPLPEELKL